MQGYLKMQRLFKHDLMMRKYFSKNDEKQSISDQTK